MGRPVRPPVAQYPFRRTSLQQRRELLLERSRLLRAELAGQSSALRERFAGAEHALGLARAATRKPVLLAAAAAALLVLKPARALRYITRGAMAVSLLRRVLGWMDREPR
jgi:hypothetical protein